MNGGQCRYRNGSDGVSERLLTSWFNNIRASSCHACSDDSDSDSDSDVTVCDCLTTTEDSTEDEVYVEVVNCMAMRPSSCCQPRHGCRCSAKPRPPRCRCRCANNEPQWDAVPPKPTRQWEENFHMLRDQWSLVTMSHSMRTYKKSNGRFDDGNLMTRPCCGCSCSRNAASHMVSVASTVVSRCGGPADYPATCNTCASMDPCAEDRSNSRWRKREDGPCPCRTNQRSPYRPAAISPACASDPPCSCVVTSAPCIVQLPCRPVCHCSPRRRCKKKRTINVQLMCKTSEANDRTSSNVANIDGSGLSQDIASFGSFPRSSANEDSSNMFQSSLYRPIDLSIRSNVTDGRMNENASLDLPSTLGWREDYRDSVIVPSDVGYSNIIHPDEAGSISTSGDFSMNGSRLTHSSARNTSSQVLPSTRTGDYLSYERRLLSDVESVTDEKSSNESIEKTPTVSDSTSTATSASGSTSSSPSTSTVEQDPSYGDTRKSLAIISEASTENTTDVNNSNESSNNGSTESMEQVDGGSGVQNSHAESIGSSPYIKSHVSLDASGEKSRDESEVSSTSMESSATSTSTGSSNQPSKESAENDSGASQQSVTKTVSSSDSQNNQEESGNGTSDSQNSIQSNSSEKEDGSRNDSNASKQSNEGNVDDRQSIGLNDLEGASTRSDSKANESNIDDSQSIRLGDPDVRAMTSVGEGSRRSEQSNIDQSFRSQVLASRGSNENDIDGQSVRSPDRGSRLSLENDVDDQLSRSQDRGTGRSIENYYTDGKQSIHSSTLEGGQDSKWSNKNSLGGSSRLTNSKSDIQSNKYSNENKIHDNEYGVGGSNSDSSSSKTSATSSDKYIESDATPSEERIPSDGNRSASNGLTGRSVNGMQGQSHTDVGSEHSSLSASGGRSILKPDTSVGSRGGGPSTMGGNTHDLYAGRSIESNFIKSNRLAGSDYGHSDTSINSMASTVVGSKYSTSDTSFENNEDRETSLVDSRRSRRESYVLQHNSGVGNDTDNRYSYGGSDESSGHFTGEDDEEEGNYSDGVEGSDVMSGGSQRTRTRSASSGYSTRSSLSGRSSRSPSSGRSSPRSVSSYRSSAAGSSGRSSRVDGFDGRSVSSSTGSSASEGTGDSDGAEVGDNGDDGYYVVENYYGDTDYRSAYGVDGDGGSRVYVSREGTLADEDGDIDLTHLDENERLVTEWSATNSGLGDAEQMSRVLNVVTESGEHLEESAGEDQDGTILRVCAVSLLVLTIAVFVALAIYFKLFNCHNWFPTKCARKEYCFFFKGADSRNRWCHCFTLW